MIFVTLGSQKFQFNRLLEKIDDLIKNEVIKDRVFAQIGASEYIPKNFESVDYMDADDFSGKVGISDIVITHGGTGAIISAVKKEKKVIAVPRLAKYGEHVDDHQLQLLKQFDEMGIIMACYDLDNLGSIYEEILSVSLMPYLSNTKRILNEIDNFLLL
ncbi:PssE/Cps14G family polysaccharide biosynthesis glycosyltransferase [Bacillus sp. OK048]|uniref:PssE/Cps14G family polysaccharide biosynthesis glycosyltransferase n=1 Tax=Bacillus sp. OK048 TaxID=1882761 RepID=UPI0008801335|nr:PssE/Cps14G family polysaccharide biosynthesis glycosyltransferase [Bacillus sp. OK048]SDN05385.1 UDP-N-acetylglucosamine transferase subunit ALG13 [Bacillus sp. OK048]